MSFSGFIGICKFLLKERLTPLQKDEIEVFLKAAEGKDQPTSDLASQRERIVAHWELINSTPWSRYRAFEGMPLMTSFFICKLVEDYLDQPFKSTATFVDVIREDSTSEISAIVELMVDPAHAQRRINKWVGREGSAHNDVQDLIDKRQWQDLAAVLLADQQLVEQVVPLSTQKPVRAALSAIQTKYFSRLSSEHDFTLTATARNLGALHDNANDTSDSDQAHLLSIESLAI